MKLRFWKKPCELAGSRAIRVLMVDDEASFARMTKRNLEAMGGFEVMTESRARAALAAARDFRPDIILLDVMMPDGGGGQVAADMAQDAELRTIPILFLTAVIKSNEVGQGGAGYIGGRYYVAKPVDLGKLVYLLREHSRVRG